MTWNYRIVRHCNRVKIGRGKKTVRSYWYAIHEAYYDKDGKLDGLTLYEKAVLSTTDDETKPDDKAGAEGVIKVLERMLRDAKKSRHDVIDFRKKP